MLPDEYDSTKLGNFLRAGILKTIKLPVDDVKQYFVSHISKNCDRYIKCNSVRFHLLIALLSFIRREITKEVQTYLTTHVQNT